MKKLAIILIGLGLALAALFFFVDREGLGAAQLLGIEAGVLLALLGAGLLTLDSPDALPRIDVGAAGRYLLSLPTSVWVAASLLAVYLAFFISPLFFGRETIQYFVKYIPDAWVTRIGFDIEQTVIHIQTWLIEGTSPYADGIVPYSPLTLLVFAPMIVLGYPAYFKLLALISIACFVIAALLLPLWLKKGNDTTLIFLFFVIGLFSYGFQFELERGQFNIIAFTACFLAIYLFHYQHRFRYFAYGLFSLAVQLKLYPAIFILMFVRDWRDWKSNLRRFLGLGIANLALLFVAGYDLGMQYVAKMIRRQGGFQSSRIEDMSISGFVYHLTSDGFGLIPQEVAARLASVAGWISALILLAFAICLAFILIDSYKRNQPGMDFALLVVCVLGGLFIPAGSFDYKLPILAAPLALFLGGLTLPSRSGWRIYSILLLILLSLAYGTTLVPFTVKPQWIAGNFLPLFIVLLCATALHFLCRRESAPTSPA